LRSRSSADCKILPRGKNVRRPPVQFDNLALGWAVEFDPISQPVWTVETEHQTGKNVVQGILEREAQENRDYAGRGE
jgi:hypothetical protein